MTNDEKAGGAKITITQTVDEILQFGPSIEIGIAPAPFDGTGKIVVLAQIDTGAICSGLRPGFAKELGLNKVGEATAHVAGLQPVVVSCFNVRFYLATIEFDLEVVELATLDPPHDVLIGRDILSNCRIEVDFTSGLIVLHIKSPYGTGGGV